jgi:hypothetical protein
LAIELELGKHLRRCEILDPVPLSTAHLSPLKWKPRPAIAEKNYHLPPTEIIWEVMVLGIQIQKEELQPY